MYDFHCNFIKTNFDANILFTDTDSFTYEIKSEDAYEEFFKYKHLFDFSEHQLNFFDLTNKKVIDKMKDVIKGIPINEFVGLKSKMHSILANNDKEITTVEGVNIVIKFNIKMFCSKKK